MNRLKRINWLGLGLFTELIGVFVAGLFFMGQEGHASTVAHTGPYVVVQPYRVLDTRPGLTPAGSTTVVDPHLPLGAVAAAVNITIADTTGGGYLTAWDGAGPLPGTSTVNADGPGQTRANFSIVPLGTYGTFAVFNQTTTGIVVDVTGYVTDPAYPAESPFVWTPDATIDLLGKSMPILKTDLLNAPSVINTCQGAVMFYGDLDTVPWIGAHRTACGDAGFGGLELVDFGYEVQIHSYGQTHGYRLIERGLAQVGDTPPPPPAGTDLVLQTSQSSTTVYLLFFERVS